MRKEAIMNGILCINKPQNMTSFDVVAKLRKSTRAKVGHSGTLDPNATGVLVLAMNQGTKALPYLGVEDKIYYAEIKLGYTTHTGDVWGDTTASQVIQEYTQEMLETVCQNLSGKYSQRVPKVSAKKIDGKRSYDYVFENKEVKQLYSDVEVYSIEIVKFDKESIAIRAHVSNGTYIRTLCEDIAEGLGNLGTMSLLNREAVGRFTLADCIDIDDLQNLELLEKKVIHTKDAIQLPRIENENMEDYVKNGKRLKLNIEDDIVLVDAQEYYAVYKREKDNIFRSVRGLW